MANFRLCAFSDEAAAPLEGQIAALHRNGLDRMEIRGISKRNISVIEENEAREIKKTLDNEGIKVFSVGSPIGKVAVTDPIEKELERLKRLINTAHILGAERMRIFSFYYPKGEDADKYFDTVGEGLLRFTEIAAGSGVLLCHENEKGIFGDVVSRCLKILEALPSIKGVFDPANFMQCSEDVLPAYRLLAPYLNYIHIKDAARDGSIYPAGHGDCEIEALMRLCAESGHTDLTAEPHLKVFAGLSELESEEKSDDTARRYSRGFKTNDEAFDTAISALKEVIEKSGNTYR